MSLGFDDLIESHISTLDPEYIDSFRELVDSSVRKKFESIDSRYEEHQQREYDDPELKYLNGSWIEDDAIYMSDVSALADELSIIALYKLFEKKHKELIQYHTGEADSTKYSYWKDALKALPENAKQLNSFKSANELRLINNSIKHEGNVSKELSDEFPSFGSKGDEFSELNKIFDRLKPGIIKYINELHHEFKCKKT